MRHSRNRKVGGGDIDEEIKTIEIKLNNGKSTTERYI